MEPTYVATASASLIGGYFLAGWGIKAVVAAAKWLAKKTKTKKDDHAIALIEQAIDEHPELVPEMLEAIRKIVR